MINIKGLDHLVLKTNKMQDMINFYCKILNCTIVRRQEAINLVQLRAGDNLIDLAEVDNEVSLNNQNMEHFCLRVSPFNAEELIAYLENINIQTYRYGKRYSSKGLGYSFYIYDPQGNEIELTGA